MSSVYIHNRRKEANNIRTKSIGGFEKQSVYIHDTRKEANNIKTK